MKTSNLEIQDIVKAWLGISLAFGIVMAGISINLITAIFLSLLTVGIGFLFHELAHKFVAQKYGCWAEFRANNQMIILAIIMSFFGFVFAAPGAVVIKGVVDKRSYGKIAASGPATNFALAILFFALTFSYSGIIKTIGNYGFLINSWLGLFNMIPFHPFDGKKILNWSKPVFGLMAGIGILFLII